MSLVRSFVAIVTVVVSISIVKAQDIFKAPERGIVSWLPAPTWEHALITGNGTMGALVMGHPHEETVMLSHGALYVPNSRSEKPLNQAPRLEEIRKLMLAGKFVEATKIPVALREQSNYHDERDPFIPAFDVKIDQQAGNVDKYNRTVNYQTGEASVNWHDDNGSFQRKVFVSRADSVVVISIKGDAKINCSIRFTNRPVEWQQSKFVHEHVGEMIATASETWLTYRSNFKNKYPGSIEGYEGVGRLILKGGSSAVVDNKLVIGNADEVLLLISIQPNYRYENSLIPVIKRKLEDISFSYDVLQSRHKAIHGKLFNRSRLELDALPEDRALNTEELLLKSKDNVSKALIEKVFDAGRYNILSCMGTNPPNLQGIWSGTWSTPWAGGMTHDGNLPDSCVYSITW